MEEGTKGDEEFLSVIPFTDAFASSQPEVAAAFGRFIVHLNHLLNFRMARGVAYCRQLFASGILAGTLHIFFFPRFELGFSATVRPGPTGGGRAHSAAPRLGGEAGAEALLVFAKLAIKRVRAESVKHAIAQHLIGFEEGMRGQESQACPGAIDVPAPSGVFLDPLLRPGDHLRGGL